MLQLNDAIILNVRFAKPGDTLQLSKAEQALIEVDAAKDALHTSKRLFESERYEDIVSFDKRCQRIIAKRALPAERLLRAGFWLIPKGAVQSWDKQLAAWRDRRGELIEEFCSVYGEAVERARDYLRALYNPSDYASVGDMRARFVLQWAYLNVIPPSSNNGAGDILAENARVLERLGQETIEECRVALREGLYQLVAKAADRLTISADGKKTVFRDTLVSNMAEFLEFFDGRNSITCDNDLQVIVDKAKAIFQEIPGAQALRKDMSLRAKVQETMASIQETMEREGFVELGRARTVELD